MAKLSWSPLTKQDLGPVVELINAAYDDWRALPRVDAYVPEDPPRLDGQTLRRAIERGDVDPSASAVVADAEGLVAVATVGFNCGNNVARMGWVAVHPRYRRRGLGSQLIEHVMEQARRRGHKTIVTASHLDSRYVPAVRLLEHAGFRWADRDRCNITMQIDISTWRPRPPELPQGYSIRSWREGDDVPWTRIKRIAFEDDTPLEYWRTTWGSRHDFDPNGWHLCLHGDEPVGIAAAVITRYQDTGRIMGCCMEWIGVLPEHRGRGLGRALMTACLNYAAPYRPEPFVLVTQPFRVAAVTLYKSLGFRLVRQWRTYSRAL